MATPRKDPAELLTPRHGMHNTPIYRVWEAMIQRCTNPNNARWADYGGRGITVADRWRDFVNFYADMGPRPDGLTLDRIDVNGNYEPGNCRWATYKEQRANVRPSTACRNGHPWTPESTGYFVLAATGNRRRRCLVCRSLWEQP